MKVNSDIFRAYDIRGIVDEELTEDDEEFVVGAIRAHRVADSVIQLYVHWDSYSEADNTWEPLENLREGASEIVDAYIADYVIKNGFFP